MTLINNLPEGKNKYENGSISLCHCRGHDCIIIVLYFDGFVETQAFIIIIFTGDYNYWFDD